jgi:hypothetical protein
MKYILFLFVFTSTFLYAENQLWTKIPYASSYGTTGVIDTPNGKTVGRFNGNIGIYENMGNDTLDFCGICFGIHERVEAGLQSDIPSKENPKINFFFKIQGTKQGRIFRLNNIFIPSTAFGINKNSAFAVIGYDIWLFECSIGYNFSDMKQGIFGNISFQPIEYLTLQTEYYNKNIGVGLRTQFLGMELSFIYKYNIRDDIFKKENGWFRIAYNFNYKKIRSTYP